MLTYQIDERLSFRLFTTSDAEEFYQLTMSSRSYLREWLGWLDYVETVEDTKQNIESRIRGLVETGGYPKSFAIIYDGRIAGTVGFNEIDRGNRCGAVGYWLGEGFQGKGIMAKSLEVLIDYGFNDLDLHKIEIRVAPGNVKSRALPERLGFKEEGVIRNAEWLYDHFVDHVVYGLLRDERAN